jgi:hypothetical protein
MQALLWLGGGVDLLQSDYISESNSEIMENTETALKFKSRVNVQNISFQEESGFMQQEGDRKYHYYGLYSISVNAGTASKIAEYDFFNYGEKAVRSAGSNAMNITKNVNLNGNRYTRNIHISLPASGSASSLPGWVNSMPGEDELWGIGASAVSLSAQSRAITDLARQVMTQVASNGTNSQQTTSVIISGAVKLKDEIASDNTRWQLWRLSKADAARAANPQTR